MRELTNEEIEKLATRKGAKKIAVENFLMSMGTDEHVAIANMDLDTLLYKWNTATQKAIRDGIKQANKERSK